LLALLLLLVMTMMPLALVAAAAPPRLKRRLLLLSAFPSSLGLPRFLEEGRVGQLDVCASTKQRDWEKCGFG